MVTMWRRVRDYLTRIALRVGGRRVPKYRGELAYWQARRAVEGVLGGAHYEEFFTTHFKLDRRFFEGRRILDVGCGPRGTLEWAAQTRLRVGVDPLALAYRTLGTAAHRMQYVGGAAEALPFADGSFDVVCSFNALDHTDDVDAAAGEMVRVLARGGTLLLLTDVHPAPTPLEPAVFSWDVVRKFALDLVDERRYEKVSPGMYESLRLAVDYDLGDPAPRYGVLSARFVKPG